MLPQAGPTLCPARLTAPLYVVDSAGGTNHYEPSLSLSLFPQDTYLHWNLISLCPCVVSLTQIRNKKQREP